MKKPKPYFHSVRIYYYGEVQTYEVYRDNQAFIRPHHGQKLSHAEARSIAAALNKLSASRIRLYAARLLKSRKHFLKKHNREQGNITRREGKSVNQ